jgi:EAL and modified HD-GYP domain-containing signal transduction protein
MSFLSSLFGRRDPAPPPPPPPPRDTLVLTGEGLDGATGAVAVTLAVGERTFTAEASRKAPGDGFPAEYALHGIEEVVPEPEPVFEAVVAEEPDPRDIAVVRLPLTDADGSVVGYELVVDGGQPATGPQATAGLLLDAFGDIGLERLSGRHPAWVTMTPEFLLEVGTPPVRPDRVVVQLPPGEATPEVLAALQRLQFSGYTLVMEEYDEALAPLCGMLKVPVAGRSDDELRAAVEALLAAGVTLVATGVANPAELVRCRALGFGIFQGDFYAKPDLTRQRRVGTGGVGALRTLAEVAAPDATFEQLEAAISSDVGLSLKLLRYVNSAFFALPRSVESVHEALTLIGTATVRRWATVMALASTSGAPEELIELALQRARMCEKLGGDAADAHFTVGLFSVADTLLDAPMDDVLETLPFSDEIRAALLRREGPKGELLGTVMAYEQGEFPAGTGELAGAYGEALEWAGGATRAAA